MQAKELGDYLKEEYGIEPAAGGAVMMAGPAAAAAEQKEEKTSFTVVLKSAGRQENPGYQGSKSVYRIRVKKLKTLSKALPKPSKKD